MQKLAKSPESGFELPLPSERTAGQFRPGQELLLLVDDALLDSRISSATAAHNARPPSPGWLRLYTEAQRQTRFKTPYMIVDMDRSAVMPLDAWERIKADAEFREAYLSDGGVENQRDRSNLEAAIAKRMEKEFELDLAGIETADITVHEPRRAVPHHGVMTTDLATLAAWDEDTGAGMFESDEL